MNPRTFVFLFLFTIWCPAVNSVIYKCFGKAQYSLSFYGMWSNRTHPNAVPPGGKFSPLVGCSHNKDYYLWAPGMMASDGVKTVAETGNSLKLESEIMKAKMYNKTVWELIKYNGGPVNGTQHVMNINVEVTQDYSLVSLVTMIAPSPDWFTGIMQMDLCDSSTGMWRDSWNVTMLHPWDAGTDDGNTFNASDTPTNPQDFISIITKSSDTPFKNVPQANIATLGTLMFQRRNKPTINMPTCTGEQKYKVKIETLWRPETHPNGFPAGAHFSPFVVATHAYSYKMWSPRTRASKGVEDVAETGNPNTLYQELIGYLKPSFVYKAYKANAALNSHGEMNMEITVKDQYSLVSLISMIAPSPDWFVGVDSLDLCGSDGKWKDNRVIILPPWDAGTESGTEFASTDIATMPQDFITIIDQNSDTVIKADASKPFAKITFERYVAMPSSSPSSAFNSSLSIVTCQSPSTERQTTPPTETSTGNSAEKACCSVSLIFLVVALIPAL